MIKIIDKWRQGIFILLSFFCFAIFFLTSLNLNTQTQSYILFFLVSLIGIPHGFFDFSIGKNIFQQFIIQTKCKLSKMHKEGYP